MSMVTSCSQVCFISEAAVCWFWTERAQGTVLLYSQAKGFSPHREDSRASPFWPALIRLLICMGEVSLPRWICLWRAFGNTTLWVCGLLLISFVLGPQSPCSRNLWSLLNTFLIHPGLERNLWISRLLNSMSLERCWSFLATSSRGRVGICWEFDFGH